MNKNNNIMLKENEYKILLSIEKKIGKLTAINLFEGLHPYNHDIDEGFSAKDGVVKQLILYCKNLNSFPEEILGFRELEVLILKEPMNIKIPANISELRKLKQLYMIAQESPIKKMKNIPNPIGNLTNLEKLAIFSVYGSKINQIPDSIGNLKNLIGLYLPYNQIKNIPESIGSLVNLKTLDLRKNQLSSLPDTIVNLQKLKKLELRENNIHFLPSSMGNMTSLKKLYLGTNLLKNLPSSMENVYLIEELDLSENCFESFPKIISKMKSLKQLNISSNNILSIPSDVVNLTSLKFLDFSNNHLTDLEILKSLKEQGTEIFY